ncbi:MAG TPA: hypothetical protein VIK78_05775 [Ruminiclostridium sp.]
MTYRQDDDWTFVRILLLTLKKVIDAMKSWINWVNKNREGKYTPTFIGLSAAFVSALLLIVMLFVPPYLGMSDDGSFARVANPVGIYHQDDTSENLYFNYYVKEYLSLAPNGTLVVSFSSQKLLIHVAKLMDTIFTHDNLFDLRFLALLYGFLFLPAIALLVKQAAKRAKTFFECVVIGLFGVLIFADVSYITYFSSFFSEPLMYISLLLCVGAALALQEEKHNVRYLLIYTISGIILTTAENQCAVIGIFLGIFCVKFLFINKAVLWRIGCIVAVFLLFSSAMLSLYYIPTTYTQASKYHAMTRGVLLQAEDPEKALVEFGIDESYSILTDTNSNDYYPFVNPENEALEKDFYNRYNTAEISYYYLRHPKAMIAMLDISVKSAFNIRGGFSGNYEKSAGMPKMAKSLFWSLWSNFKAYSAPKTVGFIILLLISSILLFRRKTLTIMQNHMQRSSIPLETMLVIFCIAISQAIITIVNSGDAEMSQHLFLFSGAIDLLVYFCFAEVLHRLNII